MKKKIGFVIVLSMILLLLAGCKPDHTLNCDINAEKYSFTITGESGATQTQYNTETKVYGFDIATGEIASITVNVNEDMTYTSSQNTYHIEGEITVDQKTNEVTYEITATGNGLSGASATCKKH